MKTVSRPTFSPRSSGYRLRPSVYSLRLFGGLSLEDSSGPLTGRVVQHRRLALLALLGAAGERGVTRDKVMGYLWPESDEASARHVLSDSLYVLRNTLGEEAILASGEFLRLNPKMVECDLPSFEEAMAREEHEAAVDLYGGPFLDGFYLGGEGEFERWVETERKRLAERYAKALDLLAEQTTATDDFPGAVEWLRRLAANDPYNSRFALRLMEAMALAGDRANAVLYAREHAQLLRDELGMEPDPDLVALAERLRQEPSSAGEVVSEQAPTVERTDTEVGYEIRRSSLGRVLLVGSVALGAMFIVWLALKDRGGGAERERTTIAVLPFDNLSPDPEDAFFTDGIHDEIITRLGKISDLKVISRTSALVYRDSPENLRVIGQQLGADNILEGSVRREADRIRITVQLIDARSDEHLWSDVYERDMSGIFAIQSEVAAQVAHAVGASLPPSERARIEKRPTQSLQAYNDYLRGRYHCARLGRADVRRSIEYFNQAIEEDPRFALAYVGLAEASMLLAELEHYPPAELARVTREPALSALEIDNTVAEAHALLAYVLSWSDFDWVGADSTFRLALELNPNSASSYLWYCQTLGTLGRNEEAIAACERGGELDPLDPFVAVNLAAAYLFYARRPDVAYTHLQRALELWPDHWVTHILLGFYYYFYMGLPDQGIAEFETSVEVAGRDIGPLAFAYAREGREADAREILRKLQERSAREYVPAFELAIVYAGLREDDEAFEMLERAYEERYFQMRSLPWNPVFDDLRTDSRFAALLEKMGLPN